MSSPTERIWFRDPRGFFADDRLAHFLPESNTTLAVQLNALMRLALYSSVLLILFRRYSLAVYVPIGVAALTFVMYVSVPKEGAGSKKREGLHAEEGTREGAACMVPTADNPFMNILLTEYSANPRRPAACDLSAGGAAARTDSLFQQNLFRDVDDVFDRRASSHNFYAMPNTQIPNDQGAFAKWCYGTGPTFKEGGLADAFTTNLQDNLGAGGSGVDNKGNLTHS